MGVVVLLAEDDMAIDHATKTKILLTFHKRIEEEGWDLECKSCLEIRRLFDGQKFTRDRAMMYMY